MTRDAGFTLLELLVAMTLLAFLSLGLVAGLRFGMAAWNKTQAKNVDANAIRTAERVLTANLARIYPKFLTDATGHGSVDFDGTDRSIAFLSTAPLTGHIARNQLGAAADGRDTALVLGSVPELARGNAGGTTQVLLRHLAAFDFAYFGAAEGEKMPAWHRDWRGQKKLPDLIRLRARFAGAGTVPWPEMILAPRIAADAGCNFDMLGKTCAGRS
ncbi:MAG TPA: type II secretion system protein [Rhizomicrobium sp.]|nr:type II secretion system protein [Rhizomicrobium sp.]